MKYQFAPSLMCMNLMELKEQIAVLNELADIYHIDIMDGHYVKNITLSPYFMDQIKNHVSIPMDAHLMTEYPNDFIDACIDAGASYITLHAETINRDAFRTINHIKDRNCKVGIILNPATSLESIKSYIHMIDKITIMTVDPGFAGQKFIVEMLDKIREAKAWKEKYGYHYIIEVDGSCNKKTFRELAEAGTEVFIVGSSGLFSLDADLKTAWGKMLEIFKECVPNAEIA